MLRAFVSDAVAAGCEVITTWDQRLDVPNGFPTEAFQLIPVANPGAERDEFARLCRQAEACYVIAPELDEELVRRVTVAQALSRRCLNASVEAVDLCGDKWAFYQHCERVGIPTILTRQLGNHADVPLPGVVKLRLGAGSQQMQLVTRESDWPSAGSESQCQRRSELLAQPFHAGHAISIAAIVDLPGRSKLLPVADQFIDPKRAFEYRGGRIPSTWDSATVRDLAKQVIDSIPGLSGYVGIDLLIPEATPDHPLVVEVNPRLTTSYIGYRRLCRNNLIQHWLEESNWPLAWNPGVVTFDAQGVVE